VNAERPGSGREKRRGGLAFWKIYTISDGWMDGWIFFFWKEAKEAVDPLFSRCTYIAAGWMGLLELGGRV
jgi:hypothetical protein